MKYWLIIFAFFLSSAQNGQAQTVGLQLNDSLAFNGYTLFAPMGNKNTYLINNCGQVVNSWQSNFSPNFTAYLTEGGKLVRVGQSPMEFTCRLERFDWEGNLEWGVDLLTPNQDQHHDIEVLPNGNIILIVDTHYTPQQALQAGRKPDFIQDEVLASSVLEIKPLPNNKAEIVWEWNIWDHLIQDFDPTKDNYRNVAMHPERFDINFSPSSATSTDWVHNNSIDYNADLDQIMLSSRNFNEIWIIDHSTNTQEAASSEGGNTNKGGDILYRWGSPNNYLKNDQQANILDNNHDAQWITDNEEHYGKISIFNNMGSSSLFNASTVEMIDPPLNSDGTYELNEQGFFDPIESTHTYEVTQENQFLMGRMSGAQLLPNGNTFVCCALTGELKEFNPQGQLLWKYILPINPQGPVAQGQSITGNLAFRAHKYAPNDPIFEGLTLQAGEPIELNPIDYGCQIFELQEIPTDTIIIANNKVENVFEISILPNPFSQFIHIQTSQKLDKAQLTITNILGKTLQNRPLSNTQTIDCSAWNKGLYFVNIAQNGQNIFSQKIIKN